MITLQSTSLETGNTLLTLTCGDSITIDTSKGSSISRTLSMLFRAYQLTCFLGFVMYDN